ncbi:MAG: SAM-dependent methyltransferase [Gemmatimonadota bacterium]
MSRAAAQTGPGPMSVIAIERTFPPEQRVVDDELAGRILPFGLRVFLWLVRPRPARDWMIRSSEKRMPGIWAGMLCRKRYIDDRLAEAANDIDAVVNLGAGFDTRGCRLPALADVPVWELDQPANIRPKRARLKRLFGQIPGHLMLVATDFDQDDLATTLAANGYTRNRRTFFLWEAVTQYLTEAAVRSTFDFLADAAAGSRLVFTYVRRDFLDGRAKHGQDALYEKYVVKRTWRFGLDPDDVAGFVGAYGWRVVEHLGYDELAEQYVAPTGRVLATTPIERIVYAEKVRQP